MSVAAALRSRFIFECYKVRSQLAWIIRTPVGNLSGIVGGLIELAGLSKEISTFRAQCIYDTLEETYKQV